MIEKISNHASSSVVTNLSKLLMSLLSTIICRIAFGKRYEDEGSWIDKLRGLHARLERNFKELDDFYQRVIEEHKDPNRQHTEEQDIIDVLLQLKNEDSLSINLTYDHIKAVIMNMLIAATDTTAATSVWAMTALIKNPRVMKRVQEEIRSVGGEKDFLDENDIKNCSYFKAMIKEILRLHLPGPLLVPRESNKEFIIDGFRIPSKTIIYVNAWAIHRDPEVWKNPEEFYPERFLDSAVDFHGQDFELIPFGTGRRICPGLPMGVATLELVLINLLHSFDWEVPQGMVKEDIDMEVLSGITQHKKNHLCLCAKRKNHM
ncbi:hypothetical protein VNO77_07221 [Canavalia gladiata]|uniref:Cytochrome P450 n=1 Tax=Canavalia gladiata TaxID=3824 RepID=A0AAN9R0H0_CANGL